MMRGKTVVITGATSGIGEVAAVQLAGMGARLIIIARDPTRGEAVLSRIEAKAPGLGHRLHRADLSRLSEMKRVAAEIAVSEREIHVLINNAGAIFAQREITEDGLEKTFALDHLSYFVLTMGLRDALLAAAPSRIVNTASDAHKGAKIDLDDLQSARLYRSYKAYGRAKLANILFTRQLARRLDGTHVTANCLHPGFVSTRFGDEAGGVISHVIRLAKFLAISPEEGAKTIVHLAASPEVEGVSGAYFYKCKRIAPAPAARDDALARALWEKSVELTGMDWA